MKLWAKESKNKNGTSRNPDTDYNAIMDHRCLVPVGTLANQPLPSQSHDTQDELDSHFTINEVTNSNDIVTNRNITSPIFGKQSKKQAIIPYQKAI